MKYHSAELLLIIIRIGDITVKITLDDTDKTLLDLLQANSRTPTAELARQLGLSRSTVKDRILRLERRGIIKAYRVEFNADYESSQITAHVMINVDPKFSSGIVRRLQKILAVKALHTVNGNHDLIAIVTTTSTQTLDSTLDEIGAVDGVEKTNSSILLSTKFER